MLYLDELPTKSCFISIDKDKWIWHRQVSHTSMKTISKLSKLDRVGDLPKLSFDKDNICEASINGKHVKRSFCKRKTYVKLTNVKVIHI